MTRTRVAVATDPYLLRSALFEALSRDDRLLTVLVGPDELPADEARRHRADVLLVSRATQAPGIRVVIVTDSEVTLPGTAGEATLAYLGVGWLAGLLAGLLPAVG